MPDENRVGSIIHVTTTQSSSLQSRLREKTPYSVRVTTPSSALESTLTPEVEFSSPNREGVEVEDEDRGDTDDTVLAFVLEHVTPSETASILERCQRVAPTIPTVVVPECQNEAHAVTALRANATEYIPADADEDPLELLLDAVETAYGDRSLEDHYHRILANELPDEAFVISEDQTYLEAKIHEDAAALYSVPPEELVGSSLDDVFPEETAERLGQCLQDTLESGDIRTIEYPARTHQGERRYEARVVPIDERIEEQRAVIWLARDVTERVRRERELRSRQDQLETISRISTVVGQVIDTLVEAPSRDTIERDVCAHLVDSELYCGSWIAERAGDGSLSYRTGSGSAESVLETRSELTTGPEWIGQQAIQTESIHTVTDMQSNDSVPEPLRQSAREDDVNSAITVPVTHNESSYGVLTVLSRRDEAFTNDELAAFVLLGETIGFTIMAVKNRQLLFADTVVELEFQIDGGNTFSFDLSESYDCTCSLEWAGTTSSGRTVQYVTIDGISGETVLEAADDHHSIERSRLIHDGGDNCTLEIRLTESGVRALANHGATIRDVTVEDGVGTCVIEISQNADVREIADALTVIYENTELVARREVDRSVQTAAERRNRILDQLTDRQLTTLRLAYYSGFFDWPRESTGEEIAEAMDVSPPTMHQHLRKGLQTVLAEFFETAGGVD
ncbi:PAS domain S-box-containing protein [Natronorubrum sediminis]|uniref:PAS domain S-box-containing protein n=1 Tax=Natronorubrum sediminis TaxID=640943 RepID=A0A1H6G471_9EURY|nr:bacterio-opsin activator domain-containing protein [Natronorubrum sediminis]SEH17881.1 PAS domain S-box-containing protein [Natronorubrum sediminis]